MRNPSDELRHTLFHLSSGFVRERDRKDVVRRYSEVTDEVCDPVGQDPSLTGTSTRDDEDRPIGGRNGLALRRIEMLKERGFGHGGECNEGPTTTESMPNSVSESTIPRALDSLTELAQRPAVTSRFNAKGRHENQAHRGPKLSGGQAAERQADDSQEHKQHDTFGGHLASESERHEGLRCDEEHQTSNECPSALRIET